MAVDWLRILPTRYHRVGRPVDWRRGWVAVGEVVRAEADELLAELGDNVVDCVVLHPCADVGVVTPDDKDLRSRVQQQADALEGVAAQIKRVLKPGGLLLTIGDQRVMWAWHFAAGVQGLSYVGSAASLWDVEPKLGPRRASDPPQSMFVPAERFVKPGNTTTTPDNKVHAVRSNVVACEPVHKAHRFMHDQLPVELYVWLLETFTEEGALVVDPMCGAGSSVVACERTGRRWIAGDRDGKCVQETRARVKDADVADVGNARLWPYDC